MCIVNNNGIDYLLNNLENDSLISVICSTLWTLTACDSIVDILVSKKTVNTLMKLLVTYNIDPKICTPICGILVKLSTILSEQIIIVNEKGISILIGFLKNDDDNLKIQAIKILVNLSGNSIILNNFRGY